MKKIWKSGIIMALTTFLLAASVYALNTDITVTFKIPSAISHQVAYRGTCDATHFYFVEKDGTYDGTDTHINVSDGSGTYCQNESVGIRWSGSRLQ